MDSPYITDIDLQPPSPSDAQATFDSFDFHGNSSFAQQSPNSYHGSYHSPYSGHSELSFPDDNLNAINNDNGNDFSLFEGSSAVNQVAPLNPGSALGLSDYDPSDFDPPNSGSSLLMFNNEYMTHYEAPLPPSTIQHGQDHRTTYDISSPSSNGESGNEDARSRASSVSSNHHILAHGNNPNSSGHTFSSPPPHISPSPRLGVAQNLENLSFNSPSWGTVPLPQQQHPDTTPINFRDNKPQSPPRLLMPDSSLSQPPPTINAPEGDDGNGPHGPSLNIVPATPISGMVNSSQVPFQGRLETVSQEPAGAWEDDGATAGFQFPQQRGTGLHSQGILNPSVSPAHHTRDLPLDDNAHNMNNNNANNKGTLTNGFLFPSNMSTPGSGPSNGNGTRLRSKSDTALEPPNWNTNAFNVAAARSGSALDDGSLPHHHHQGSGSFTPDLAFTHPASTPSPAPHLTSTDNDNNNNFLSPDMGHRRARSDTGGRPGHIRHSRSEDLRGIGLGAGITMGSPGLGSLVPSTNQSLGMGSPPLGHASHAGHGHSQSYSHTPGPSSSPYLFPPSSQQDFLQRQQQQFLRPSGMVGMELGMGADVPSIGAHSRHYRRASSGSRSERGISTFSGGLGVGGSLGVDGPGGGWSGPSSARASPYPSPNVSPRVRYEELPNTLDVGGIGVGTSSPAMGVATLPPGGGLGMGGHQGGGASILGVATVNGVVAPSVPMGVQVPITVSKPNVTTGRTANASHKRRKQEATFVCPVPGCGSTFTRSFNLKGHIRSHNEEKPFQCHWPGCGKGFARQHDCKRHEQLHTNYRPFTCEGCNKQFARMDALNRHLRSEGGAECQRTLESSGNLPPGVPGQGQGGLGVTKKEEGWSSPVGVAL